MMLLINYSCDHRSNTGSDGQRRLSGRKRHMKATGDVRSPYSCVSGQFSRPELRHNYIITREN